MSTKPVYILGTGLSHDGSACILKDGRITVAIEKERLTRIKHDGGNDAVAVQYCLDALNIQLTDLSLIVQVANFEKEISPERYAGKRLYHPDIPVVTISHHLAHAYSAIATSPFQAANVLVIDGAGSPAGQCDDWPDEATRQYWCALPGFYCEKDSFYHYDGHELHVLKKDFSECRIFDAGSGGLKMPTTYHSIGGVYAAASHYCFGNLDDVGKLMGLAPYGDDEYTGTPIFCLENGIVQVHHENMTMLQTPAADYPAFKTNFQHYANVARWVQKETERAVLYVARSRMELSPHDHLCYAGGVALNAVCNQQLLHHKIAKNLYIQPAAGDNGLSIGCAFYGWQQVLKKEKVPVQTPSVFFGRSYTEDVLTSTLENHPRQALFSWKRSDDFIRDTAIELAAGKVVAWYQGGAEFGPRALGHRSILADPRIKGIQLHINRDIKFREDFRPFAPSVLQEEVTTYFRNGWDSPHMILIDEIREEWAFPLQGIVHKDGTCRVQTVDAQWNPDFHQLLQHFKAETGIAVLVNTSFNKKGMPIVETPQEALDFFLSCALDLLVIDQYIITKKKP